MGGTGCYSFHRLFWDTLPVFLKGSLLLVLYHTRLFPPSIEGKFHLCSPFYIIWTPTYFSSLIRKLGSLGVSWGLTECELKEIWELDLSIWTTYHTQPNLSSRNKLISPLHFIVGVVLSFPDKRVFTLTTGLYWLMYGDSLCYLNKLGLLARVQP